MLWPVSQLLDDSSKPVDSFLHEAGHLLKRHTGDDRGFRMSEAARMDGNDQVRRVPSAGILLREDPKSAGQNPPTLFSKWVSGSRLLFERYESGTPPLPRTPRVVIQGCQFSSLVFVGGAPFLSARQSRFHDAMMASSAPVAERLRLPRAWRIVRLDASTSMVRAR